MPGWLAGPPDGTGRLRAIRDYPEAKIPLVWVENPPLSQRVQSEKMSMRILRALAAVGAVLLFAGCETALVDTDTTFNPTYRKAIVVVGIGKELTADYAHYQAFIWRPYDPETGRPMSEERKIILRWSRCWPPENKDECEPSGFKYYAFIVDPGDYFFHYVFTEVHAQKHVRTYLTGKEKAKRGTRVDRWANVLESKAPRFNVEAGEAIYIGDFIFGGHEQIRSLKNLRFDLTAARTYMSQFPDVAAPLEPRPAMMHLLTN